MTLKPANLSRLANAATLLVVVALAFQVAWWSWHFLAPQPTAAASEVAPPIDRNLARSLFGEVGVVATAGSSTTSNASGIRLKGVFAVDGKTLSAAVVNSGGRDASVRVGEAIADGIKLVEVAASHIVISRNGIREKIELDRMSAANTASGTSSTAAGKAAALSTFRLNVASTVKNAYSLSRSELNNVLQDPNQINFLGNIAAGANGGVQVRDAPSGSLAQKLGLQPGDIISSINGQPVTGPGDLARFYGQFGSTNSIRAEVRRGGAPMLLTYAINP